jgi:protein TonB
MASEREGDQLAEADSPMMLVALIGPDSASRSIMARALAAPDSRIVHEFSNYPEMRLEILQMLSEHFDFLMIDLDSDTEYALHLVEMLAALDAPAVMVYSKRDDPALMEKAREAGARDFFPLPANAPDARGPVAAPSGALREAPSAGAAGVEAPKPSAMRPDMPPQRTVEPAQRYPDSVSAQEIRRTTRIETAERKVISRSIDDGITEVSRNGGVVPLRPAIDSPISAQGANAEEDRRQSARAEISVEGMTAADTFRPGAVQPFSPPPAPASIRREVQADPQGRVSASVASAAGGLETDAGVLHLARQIREANASESPAKPRKSKTVQSRQEPAEDETESADWKRRILVAAGPVAMVLLVGFFLLHPSRKSAPLRGPAEPAVSQPQSQLPPPAAAVDPAAAPARVTEEAAGAKAPVVDPPPMDKTPAQPADAGKLPSGDMTAQFTSPERITRNEKNSTVTEAAPNALALGSLDAGPVTAAVLGGSHRVNVRPEVANVSAGVAAGMLIRKTTPVFPAFAKEEHLSGTVVLKANITKEGKITGLQVVSGPQIFVGPAVEAVKAWRYRPYMLDNKPVEVETSISVVFSADNR